MRGEGSEVQREESEHKVVRVFLRCPLLHEKIQVWATYITWDFQTGCCSALWTGLWRAGPSVD